ncbi:MAG: methyltransferase domain-containing protein, partial [Streptosporangiaceae bacterium]
TSQAMLAEARRRADGTPLPIQFRQGKADGLPLASHEVDACRADTLLQHVPDPAGVIAEMTRVTRPGGRISVLEFDLGTLTIDHPDQATTGRLVQAAVAAFPDGRAGRGLRRLLTHAGLADVTVHTQFVEPDLPFLLRVLQPAFIQLSAEQLGRWQADLDHAWRSGTFTAGALVFVATARIPVMAARETSEVA